MELLGLLHTQPPAWVSAGLLACWPWDHFSHSLRLGLPSWADTVAVAKSHCSTLHKGPLPGFLLLQSSSQLTYIPSALLFSVLREADSQHRAGL